MYLFTILLIILLTFNLDLVFCGLVKNNNNVNLLLRNFDGRIVGGKPVDIKSFPYQVSLQGFGYHKCGGSIISDRFVLTAAHCTFGSSANDLTVRIGSDKHYIGGNIIQIKNVINHPNFNYGTIDYDYSLLELNETLSFTDNIKPIELQMKNRNVKDDVNCTVSGWGDTMSQEESSSELRATVVPKVNDAKCSDYYNGYGEITERMFCAGYTSGGHDSCQGDSGGPLKCEDVLAGVVSWGVSCAKPKFPGVYSKISVVRDWINEITGLK